MAEFVQVFTRGSLSALLIAWAAASGGVGVILLLVTQGWLPPVIGGVVGAFIALNIAYHNVASDRDALREKVDALARSSPCFRFSETRWTPLHNTTGGYMFHGLQVWLKNEPEIRGEEEYSGSAFRAELRPSG